MITKPRNVHLSKFFHLKVAIFIFARIIFNVTLKEIRADVIPIKTYRIEAYKQTKIKITL